MDVIINVVDFLKEYFNIFIEVVGVFALIAAATPNKSDDKIVQVLLNLVNFLGANFGKASNEEKSN